eukprot:Tbor_TRINITY_DN5377_c3_g13::TRINITY_DN5377_c3_g13_i1::g.4474::m.4474/K03868/RBX1, ROC1; RING-box protein 1
MSSDPPVYHTTLKTIRAVSLFTSDITTKYCGLCKNSVANLCISCCCANDIDRNILGACVVVVGNCKHAFHLHCISGWLKSSDICPECRGAWTVSRVEDDHL